MRIYILRHAIAEDSAKGGDTQRALSDEGRKKMKDAAAGFARMDPAIDLIYSSPLVRAVQTAEILAKAIQYPRKVETLEELSPGHTPESVVQKLKTVKKAGSVVLSGHEPNCSQLASFLLGKADVEFKKGAICLIETESYNPGSGTLIWHLTPQVMRFMKK
jgi:phosphohistidine phosphatase